MAPPTTYEDLAKVVLSARQRCQSPPDLRRDKLLASPAQKVKQWMKALRQLLKVWNL